VKEIAKSFESNKY